MKLDIGKTYVAFRIKGGKLMPFGTYIKPAYYREWNKDKGELWISFIESNRLKNIENIKVDTLDDYLIKQIRHQHSGEYIMDYKDLDKKRASKVFNDIFYSYREEIDLDFNGDEDSFFKYKRWNVEYHTPKEYESKFYKGDYFDSSLFCIPLDVAIKDYSFMFRSQRNTLAEVFLDKDNRKFVVRDYKIKQVLDLC